MAYGLVAKTEIFAAFPLLVSDRVGRIGVIYTHLLLALRGGRFLLCSDSYHIEECRTIIMYVL